MFNRGIEALLAALPSISGLGVAEIRRLLTRAWLETTDARLGADVTARRSSAADLRRLATALELHAILPLDAAAATVAACSLVAAEALTIAHELAPLGEREGQATIFGSVRRFELVEAGLLYLIAGYDANAALTMDDLGEPPAEPEAETLVSEWALARIVRLLRMVPIAATTDPPPPPVDAPVRSAVRHEIWRRIGVHVEDHVDWLTFRTEVDSVAGTALRQLAEQLEGRQQNQTAAAHPDLHHLLLLLAAACDGTAGRALRVVPPPPDDDGRFSAYQRVRAASRPLLWPAAQDYARQALPGPHAHAVVAVPTGSGKSSVAELAISQALGQRWVLYLAPTNALVAQIRRHTTSVFGAAAVQDFVGGAEYTQMEGESLTDIDTPQILVMTQRNAPCFYARTPTRSPSLVCAYCTRRTSSATAAAAA